MTKKLIHGIRMMMVPVLLVMLLFAAVNAEEITGTLHILLTDQDGALNQGIAVLLCRVAEADGTLTPDFSDAGISPEAFSDSEQQAKIARTLAAYAASRSCPAQKQTTDARGEATFTPLQEGIYLARCADGQKVVFPSFLVRLPMELDGKLHYEVDAFPKSEDAQEPEPTAPAPTEPGGDPNIPQTGWDPLPAMLLTAGGVILLAVGVFELIRSRKDSHE